MYYASSSSRLLECKTNYMVPSGSRQLQACKTGQPTRHIRLYRIRYCIRGSCGNRYRAHVYARQAACIIPLARARRRHPPRLGRPLAGRPRAAGVTPAQGRGCRSAAAGSPGRTRARPRARPAASATCARPAPRRARAWAPARARHSPTLLCRSGVGLRQHSMRMHTNGAAWRGAPSLLPRHPLSHTHRQGRPHARGTPRLVMGLVWVCLAGGWEGGPEHARLIGQEADKGHGHHAQRRRAHAPAARQRRSAAFGRAQRFVAPPKADTGSVKCVATQVSQDSQATVAERAADTHATIPPDLSTPCAACWAGSHQHSHPAHGQIGRGAQGRRARARLYRPRTPP